MEQAPTYLNLSMNCDAIYVLQYHANGKHQLQTLPSDVWTTKIPKRISILNYQTGFKVHIFQNGQVI